MRPTRVVPLNRDRPVGRRHAHVGAFPSVSPHGELPSAFSGRGPAATAGALSALRRGGLSGRAAISGSNRSNASPTSGRLQPPGGAQQRRGRARLRHPPRVRRPCGHAVPNQPGDPDVRYRPRLRRASTDPQPLVHPPRGLRHGQPGVDAAPQHRRTQLREPHTLGHLSLAAQPQLHSRRPPRPLLPAPVVVVPHPFDNGGGFQRVAVPRSRTTWARARTCSDSASLRQTRPQRRQGASWMGR